LIVSFFSNPSSSTDPNQLPSNDFFIPGGGVAPGRKRNKMSERSWFYAAQGQQQGPFPEAQLRSLIARGTIAPDTLLWTDGMAGWERAEDIPGLMSAGARPPAVPQPDGAIASGEDQYSDDPYASSGEYRGEPLSVEPGLWGLFGRGLLYCIGILLVIPAPWVATSFYRWMATRMQIPERPNLAFNGQVGDIWYVFVGIGLLSYAGLGGNFIHLLAFVGQAYLSWMVLRWIAANLSSNGQPLPIAFEGSVLTYIGWHLLLGISAITIIGWAWVVTAWMRWNCRNVVGTRREILFTATGLSLLWRTVVFGLACGFIIPIPWMLRWYSRWYVSQFELADRVA
jgi:GYF domain 2